MKQKRGRFKELLKNNLLSVILILVVLFSVVVIAGDVVVQNGQMTLEEDFIVNNSNLFVDVSSGNVGIGTLSPTQKLHVVGDENFSESYNSLVFIDNAGQIILSDGSGSATPGIDLGWSWNGAIANISLPFATRNIDGLKIGTSSNYPVSFMMSGQPRLYLEQTTGDVGIGTAAPTHKLNVVGDVNVTGNIYHGGSLIEYSPMIVESAHKDQSVIGMKADNGEWVGCGAYYVEGVL